MNDQHTLQSDTILDRYRIIRILGEGGFGITYLAEDIQLGLKVVIKEYFPNEFSIRSGNSTITAKSKSVGDFAKGMQRFKEEAITLAKFNHPSIVKILGYFEANSTAYFVMEYEEGIDLSQYLKQNSTSLGQEEILSIIMPILEGLKEVHKYNYLHRDIKPGNILLRSNKSPVLIDFGASKLALGEASKSITSMLTEGYAPLEQYSTDVKRQGPYTDIYATAAVMYKMITGKVPPSAQTRSYQLLSDDDDPFKSLSTMNLSGYDTHFLKAVDSALSIKAKDRPRNVQDFQAALSGKLNDKRIDLDHASMKPNDNKNNKGFVVFFTVLLLIIGGYFYLNKSKNIKDTKSINKDVILTNIKNDQELLNVKQQLKNKIEAERLKKEQEEIESLRKEKEVAQKAELERLRKEKSESKRIKFERLRLEKEKAERQHIESERIRLEQEKASREFSLTVQATPSNAKVQILNIKPKYYGGIRLKKGSYEIKVSKKGYKTVRKWIRLEKNEYFTIKLRKYLLKKTSYNSVTRYQRPSLTHLTLEEKDSIAYACSSTAYSDPDKYNKCLQRQLYKLGK